MDTSEWILDINSLKKEPLKRGRFFILKSGKRGHFSHLIKGNIKEKDISKRRNERNTGTTSQAIYSEIVNSMLGEYRKAFHHHFKEYPDKARTRDCLRAFRKIVKENYALLVDSDKGDVSVFPKTVEHWMRYNLHPSRDLYPKQYPPWWLYKDFQVIRSDYERQKDYVPFPEIKENVK
jgi:hypothetical protein